PLRRGAASRSVTEHGRPTSGYEDWYAGRSGRTTGATFVFGPSALSGGGGPKYGKSLFAALKESADCFGPRKLGLFVKVRPDAIMRWSNSNRATCQTWPAL